MENEHKDLLIADLCGRLPYKVIVEFVSYKGEEKPWIGELSCKDLDCFIHDVGFIEIKPYLFPMSSMTKEQKQEYQYITERWMYDSSYSISDSIDWLHKNNFDYRGLIPMGLANNAVGLNLYSSKP